MFCIGGTLRLVVYVVRLLRCVSALRDARCNMHVGRYRRLKFKWDRKNLNTSLALCPIKMNRDLFRIEVFRILYVRTIR